MYSWRRKKYPKKEKEFQLGGVNIIKAKNITAINSVVQLNHGNTGKEVKGDMNFCYKEFS